MIMQHRRSTTLDYSSWNRGPFWPVKGLPVTAARIVLAVLVVVVLVISMLMHSGLVRRRNQVDNAWSQIDVQLKRRYDLITTWWETAMGYANHERGTLEAVTEARAIDARARRARPRLRTRSPAP